MSKQDCSECVMPNGQHYGPCTNNAPEARAAFWAQKDAERAARMASRSWMQKLRMLLGTPEYQIANELERAKSK